MLVALALAALRCWGLATVQVPFNGWDEVAHLAAAFHVYKYDRMPSPEDGLDPELIPFVGAHPHPRLSAGVLKGIDTPRYKGTDARCSGEPAEMAPFKQYQAQHGPVFYYLMASLLGGSDPESLLAWADLGRVLNSVFLLGFLGVWYFVLCRLRPSGRLAWLPEGVLLLLVSFSFTYFTFVRFANDGLSLLLASLSVAWYVLGGRVPHGPAWRQALNWGGVGLLVGLAVLTKATALPLLAVFGGLLAWRLWRGPGRGPVWLCLAAFLAAYCLTAGPYHLHCLTTYGQLTGMQEAVMNARHGVGVRELLAALPALHYGLLRNHFFYYCIAFIGGWSSLFSPDWSNMTFRVGLEGCLVSLAVVLCVRSGRARVWRFLGEAPELPLLVGATWLGLLYHAVQSQVAWGVCTTNPWYAMVSQPAFFALLCLGPGLLHRRMAWMWVLALAFVFNAAHLEGTYNLLLRQETGIADLGQALAAVMAHHRLFRMDIQWLVVADVVCLFFLTTLCLERIERAWLQSRQDLHRPRRVGSDEAAVPLRLTPPAPRRLPEASWTGGTGGRPEAGGDVSCRP